MKKKKEKKKCSGRGEEERKVTNADERAFDLTNSTFCDEKQSAVAPT